MGFKNPDTTELKSQPGLYESGTIFPLDKLSGHVTLDLLVAFVRPQAPLCPSPATQETPPRLLLHLFHGMGLFFKGHLLEGAKTLGPR